MSALADLDRRLQGVLQVGVVTKVDAGNAVACVKIGDLSTPMIPWMTIRAGGVQFWWAPSVGEQVIVGAASGDIEQGVILGSIYTSNAPSSDASTPMINLEGGNMKINGTLIVTGDVVANGVSLVDHTHGGIALGSSDTRKPNK